MTAEKLKALDEDMARKADKIQVSSMKNTVEKLDARAERAAKKARKEVGKLEKEADMIANEKLPGYAARNELMPVVTNEKLVERRVDSVDAKVTRVEDFPDFQKAISNLLVKFDETNNRLEKEVNELKKNVREKHDRLTEDVSSLKKDVHENIKLVPKVSSLQKKLETGCSYYYSKPYGALNA